MAAKKNQKIDTKALLSRLDIVEVIDKYVPLKKDGAEYAACCPFHNEATPSFKVSPSKQIYHCFGCGANGDAIDFVREYEGLTFIDAVKRLGGDVPDGEAQHPDGPEKRPGRVQVEEVKWKQVTPIPEDAFPEPVAHTYRGRPEMKWTYRDGSGAVLGYVYRFIKSEGGKETIPLCYMEHPDTGVRTWRWHSFSEPRPLYGLDRLAARPSSWVLIVEGEKCADAAQEILPEVVVMAWPGGCKAVDKIDLGPLKGCNVILWPDCDAKLERTTKDEVEAGIDPLTKPLLHELEQPGMVAMERIAHELLRLGEGTRARIVNIPAPGSKPDGWDVYDAIHVDGMDYAEIMRMCTNVRDPAPFDADTGKPVRPDAAKKPKSKKQPRTPSSATAEDEDDTAGRSSNDSWFDGLIRKNKEIISCLSNIYDMLNNSKQWGGVLGFDESSQRVVKRAAPPYEHGRAGEWEDQDDARTAMWLGRRFYFSPSLSQIRDAVDVLARENSFHPIQEWLKGLKWDGQPRLDDWMSDHLGVAKSEYSMKVARWFLIGMVARAMTPGCKFDYCLILEGEQGLKKSSVLRAIGGEWFGDTDLDLHSKDSMDSLRGKWLYEFAEMGSVTRVESSKQKSFISRQIDEFRPAYGTRNIKCPRQVVFGGTVNDWEWNKDPTGGRRFWPVRIHNEIDDTAFGVVREQLFAEAYQAWLAGEKYWPTREEQKALFDPVQLASSVQESFVDALADFVGLQSKEFSISYAAKEGLGIDASKLTRDIQTRIGIALRELGCTRVEKRTNIVRFWYMPPENPSYKPAQPQGDEDDHVPF